MHPRGSEPTVGQGLGILGFLNLVDPTAGQATAIHAQSSRRFRCEDNKVVNIAPVLPL